jgi:acyl-CoA hydrolase
MHLEDKNLSGKIFGGLIMRYGYELGWLCARKFL